MLKFFKFSIFHRRYSSGRQVVKALVGHDKITRETIEKQDRDGHTALWLAVEKKFEDVALLIAEKMSTPAIEQCQGVLKVDYNFNRAERATILQQAVALELFKLVNLVLLRRCSQAYVDRRDSYGHNALWYVLNVPQSVCYMDHESQHSSAAVVDISVLITQKMSPQELVEKYGKSELDMEFTALHIAARHSPWIDSSKLISTMLQQAGGLAQEFAGATDKNGNDALWYVVRDSSATTGIASRGASALSILSEMSTDALKRSIAVRRGTDADRTPSLLYKLSERTMIADSFFDIMVKEIQHVKTAIKTRTRFRTLDPVQKNSNTQRLNWLKPRLTNLSRNADILATTTDHRGSYALCYLFRHSAPEQTVRFFMPKMQRDTLRNFRDEQGNSFLHLAVGLESKDSEQNGIKFIDLFQKQHPDIVNILRDEINAAGQTPFELAQQNKLRFELQGSLLQRVKSISRQDVLTRRDFYKFCRDTNKTDSDVVEAAKKMVPASIDKPLTCHRTGTKTDDWQRFCDGRTVLHFAADFGRGVTVIDALINSVPQDDRQQFVERRDGREFTALDYATRKIEDGSDGETIISGAWNLQEETQRREVALRLIELMSQAAVLAHWRGGEVLNALLDDSGFPENHHSTREIIRKNSDKYPVNLSRSQQVASDISAGIQAFLSGFPVNLVSRRDGE